MQLSSESKCFIEKLDLNKKLPGPRSKKYQKIYENIRECTKHLPESYTLSQRVWVIKHKKMPKCVVCGKDSKLTRTIPIRERCCSIQCASINPSRKEKTTNTCIEKYGVHHPMLDKTIASKVSTAMKGSTREFREHYPDMHDTLYNKEWLTTQYITKEKTVAHIAQILGVTEQTIYIHLKRNGIPLSTKRAMRSVGEDSILEFLSGYINQNDILLNSRSLGAREIDIYLKEYNLGIEYDGLYWHSSKHRAKEYHQKKKLDCMKNGIRLISIFEHEYMEKKDIIHATLLANIGIYDRKIRASKCDIRSVESKECRDFFNKNHIQGGCNFSVAYGLYYEDELVYCMSFGNPRFDSTHEWEIIRMAGAMGNKVYGAAGRLWKYFKNQHNPISVVSYCNLRYGHGNVYKILGFSQDSITPPSYFYFSPKTISAGRNRKKIKTISRYQAQKQKLPKLLGETFDINKTEEKNMLDAGYFKVYDAGNLKFIWNN